MPEPVAALLPSKRPREETRSARLHGRETHACAAQSVLGAERPRRVCMRHARVHARMHALVYSRGTSDGERCEAAVGAAERGADALGVGSAERHGDRHVGVEGDRDFVALGADDRALEQALEEVRDVRVVALAVAREHLPRACMRACILVWAVRRGGSSW
eukprot:5300905-Pleurochrysis_carterae.AAC.1